MAKAGQLGVMEALLDALSLHKANSEVSREFSRAIANICYYGIDQRHRSLSSNCDCCVCLAVLWRCKFTLASVILLGFLVLRVTG